MRAYAGTDIGCVRTMNQDGYFCSMTPIGPFPNLFIVADGMGGDVKMEKIRELLYCDLYLMVRK